MTTGLAGGRRENEPTGRGSGNTRVGTRATALERSLEGELHALSPPPGVESGARHKAQPQCPRPAVIPLLRGAGSEEWGVQGKGRETLRPTPIWRDAAGRVWTRQLAATGADGPAEPKTPKGHASCVHTGPACHPQQFRQAPQTPKEHTRRRLLPVWVTTGRGPWGPLVTRHACQPVPASPRLMCFWVKMPMSSAP